MESSQDTSEDTKYVGVRIQKDLYWQIREKLLEKRLSMSEAIINGLLAYLDLPLQKGGLLKDK